MNTARLGCTAVLLLCAQAFQTAEAGVFACKGRDGVTYYTDNACKPGDVPAKSSGKGNMSTYARDRYSIGGSAASGDSYASPTYGGSTNVNSYARRAENGANTANQALGK